MRTNRASEERHATALSSIVDLRSSKPASAQDAVERAGSVALLARECVQDKVLISLHAASRPRTVAEYCWCHSNTTSLIPSRMVLRHHAEAPLPAARSRLRRQRRPSVTLACPAPPHSPPTGPPAPGAASRSIPEPYKTRATIPASLQPAQSLLGRRVRIASHDGTPTRQRKKSGWTSQ